MIENIITSQIIGAAIKVHRILGPGLLESSYEKCLTYELRKLGYKVETQKYLPLNYDGVILDAGYRIDLLVDDSIVIELKAVAEIHPVHHAQVLTYLKLSKCKVGLIINFNVALLKNGVKRFIM